MSFSHEVHCTYRQWIGKPDPSGFGKYVYHTNRPEEYAERAKANGHRVNKIRKVKPK